MKSKYFIFLIFILLSKNWVQAQGSENPVNPNGYNVFYYTNGVKSSEGMFRDGKPDGYWKTYYEDGKLKSEGNRKNYELDSLWKFYDDSTHLILSINYLQGKKNGLRTTYREGETMVENFEMDVKQGPTKFYYPGGKLKMEVPFVDGLEQGFAREYDEQGEIITFMEYKKGFLVSRERINRTDKNGKKQGRWKYFWDNGLVKLDGTYKDDLRNGYFKEYDEEGLLLTVKKFENDQEVKEAPELTSLSIKTDYYPSGKVKTVASYNGDVPEGVRREYSEDGKITGSYIFKSGAIVGEGIIDEEGVRNGPWKEYYADGTLRAVGNYDKGLRIGDWKFYHENGNVEQEGRYNKKGHLDGTWLWYYDDGTLRREQTYIDDLEDSDYKEYDEKGNLIVKGQYAEGLEEGEWTYDFGAFKETGTYKAGVRNGKWKSYYSDGTLRFEGSYVDDNLNSQCIWYWPNGKKKDAGRYVNGNRDGEWQLFNEDGTLQLVINYRNGTELSYDGVTLKPPFEE